MSRFCAYLRRVPSEPEPLSVDVASDAVASSLSLRIAAPRALSAEDVRFDVLQPWCTPFRLAPVAAHLPAEYDALGSACWRAAVETFIDVTSSNATLENSFILEPGHPHH